MTTPKPQPPGGAGEQQRQPAPGTQERGTNEVEHEPDPSADHKPDGEQRHVWRSPYTTGNY